MKGSIITGLVVAGVILAGLVGWGLNVYKFTQLDFESPYKAEVIRVIGIPVPFVGAIGGWMDIGEENK